MLKSQSRSSRVRTGSSARALFALAVIVSLTAAGAVSASAENGGATGNGTPKTGGTAILQNFIAPDPLGGDDGLPTSPAVTENYGGINLVMDVDGNAIEATRENDIRFFEGSYYLYGTSQACGSFDYSPRVQMSPMVDTTPKSLYRYCGITIYESKDLMNWELVSRFIPQDPQTGTVRAVKKPRVVYSPSTDTYVMWVHDKGSEGDGTPRIKIMTSDTPVGPWSSPSAPVNTIDVPESDLFPDFNFNNGPDGSTWMVTSHGSFAGAEGAVFIWKLTDGKTGVAAKSVVQVTNGDLFGGIGLSFNDGWWYITGTPICGNCVYTRFGYIMARDPFGPWISPGDGSTLEPLDAEILSTNSANAQPVGATVLPDSTGDTNVLIPLARYRSSPTAAPGTAPSQSGDDNFALAGLGLMPLSFDESGRIQPWDIKAANEFPIANKKKTEVPTPYEAHLAITSTSSVTQSWTVPPGTKIAAVLPSVFQRTPDTSRGTWAPVNEPMLNAPLDATLELPNGETYSWSIDPLHVSWSPHQLPLNLPTTFKGAGEVSLTLSTTATNGGYGVAVGPNTHENGEYIVTRSGTAVPYPAAGMYFTTSRKAIDAPDITMQPQSVTVAAGATVGFSVAVDGVGVGYQWQRNGVDVTSPSGFREATAPALRLQNVTVADAGVYSVVVSNPVGSVASVEVRLEVTE